MNNTNETIDKVLKLAREVFCVDSDNGRGKRNADFVAWQIENHPEYDLDYAHDGTTVPGVSQNPYIALLVDKLLIFSYMMGDTQLSESKAGSYTKIGRDGSGRLKPVEKRSEDLHLLSMNGEGARRTDSKLERLLERHDARQTQPAFSGTYQSWEDIIDEIGQYPAVVKQFGKALAYDLDVARRNRVADTE